MSDSRIPKIIHYCWFGGKEKPAEVEYCIASWRQFLPDYEIMEWNEGNFSVEDSVPYVREAYSLGKWAFVSDYVRLYALKQYGGFYFDTDVEVFRSFDELLRCPMVLGFESNDYLTTAVIGCEPETPLIAEFLDDYQNRHFILPDGTPDMETTNVVKLTRMMVSHGLELNGKLQRVGDAVVFPQWYFSANDLINIVGKYRKDGYAYHHMNASWYDKKLSRNFLMRVRRYVLGVARNTVGTQTLYNLRHRK